MRKLHLAAIFLLIAGASFGFEIGASFDLSNLDFPHTRTSDATTLPGENYLWGMSLTWADQFSDNLALDVSFSRDTVLRNVAYTRLAYQGNYFTFNVGPFFGFLNSPTSLLQSGLSTSVELSAPGIVFVRLRSDSTLGARLAATGDYLQERSEIAVGFYSAHVFPTLYVRTRDYIAKSDTGETVDSRTEYGVSVEIFQKGMPYQVMLDLAYQDGGREFIESTTVSHSFGAVVVGVRVQAVIGDFITAIASLDSSVYTFGRADLLGEVTTDAFLFRVTTGVRLDLSSLPGRP